MMEILIWVYVIGYVVDLIGLIGEKLFKPDWAPEPVPWWVLPVFALLWPVSWGVELARTFRR